MHQADFDGFSSVLGKLAVVYGKKLDNEMVQAYWSALKDQSLATVQELANTHTRYGKFFPKPVELRPKESRDKPMEHTYSEKAEERAMQRLEEQRIQDPAGWMKTMVAYDPYCRATQLARIHGAPNIWYDIPARRWRHP
jgi:hypothetical protein